MRSQDIKKRILELPDSPGVYLFKHAGKILYIGKATSLRDRVKSYMSKTVFDTRSPLIEKMLNEFDKIDFIKTDSVLEALVLEAHLIKKHQPSANIKEKDNKSFNFVVITKDPIKSNGLKSPISNGAGDFPCVNILRGRELLVNKPEGVLYSFGPFPNGSQLKEAMKIVRKMFPFRDKCLPLSGKPCFNRQIGLCPGVCTGEITKEQYSQQIKNIILFFEGNKKQLLKNLEKQMQSFAKEKEFEKANIIKRTLFTLNHIQDVSLIKEEKLTSDNLVNTFRIESYDIAHMSGQNVVGVMTVVEDGEVKKSDYRKFKIKEAPRVNDTKALKEVLKRRLGHIEWRFPDLIVVDGGIAQKRIMEKILKENSLNIPVVSVVKDERHRAREIMGDRSIALTAGKKWSELERDILLSNAEAHRYAISFHKQLRGKIG